MSYNIIESIAGRFAPKARELSLYNFVDASFA